MNGEAEDGKLTFPFDHDVLDLKLNCLFDVLAFSRNSWFSIGHGVIGTIVLSADLPNRSAWILILGMNFRHLLSKAVNCL